MMLLRLVRLLSLVSLKTRAYAFFQGLPEFGGDESYNDSREDGISGGLYSH